MLVPSIESLIKLPDDCNRAGKWLIVFFRIYNVVIDSRRQRLSIKRCFPCIGITNGMKQLPAIPVIDIYDTTGISVEITDLPSVVYAIIVRAEC